jgi:HK97 family phage prohead protease
VSILYRHGFAGDLEVRDADDGRSYVAGRVVPFGAATTIVEPDESGQLVTYRERFLPGCLDRQAKSVAGQWRHVKFKLGHSDMLEREVGAAVALEERPDGVHGTFRLFRGADLDKVRSMLEDAYTGLSVEFRALRTVTDGDLQSRAEVYIGGVAATPIPAYPGALITAVREQTVDLDATPRLDAARKLLDELRATLSPA